MSFNLGAGHALHFTGTGALTVRFDVINVFDRPYEIGDGTGIGVGAAQFATDSSPGCRSSYSNAGGHGIVARQQ
jgi:hypothetical protein